ncbi:MAG: arylsulfatase, partial [Candidatus Brocadiaceae bacterium]
AVAAAPPVVRALPGSRDKPNLIYILADDLGYGDVGCYGQDRIRTPSLDRMAAEGMRFTQHYAGSTVCAPSRCSLMTGQHTGHTWIRANGRAPIRPEDVTVAEVLQDAGYATGMAGKWGLGHVGTTGDPNRKGFDHFFGYVDQGRAHFYYTEYLWRNGEKVVLADNEGGKRGTYSHDLIAAEGLEFIRKNREGPFLLYLPYTIPHAEVVVPEDSLAEYRGKFPEKPFPGGHYCAQETPNAARAGMITRMDRDIGRVFALLKELGLDEDTLVMFSSDNGPCAAGGQDYRFFESQGPLRGIKRDLYDGGIRVPTIARWPGKIDPGAVSEHVSAFWDVLPTFAELAGVEPPADIDGISMAPALLGRGDEQKQHEYLYWEHKGDQAVRMGDWKGVRNKGGDIELFDLGADIGEKNDLAAGHPDIVARMRDMMKTATTGDHAGAA